jgi:hypothetical protein
VPLVLGTPQKVMLSTLGVPRNPETGKTETDWNEDKRRSTRDGASMGPSNLPLCCGGGLIHPPRPNDCEENSPLSTAGQSQAETHYQWPTNQACSQFHLEQKAHPD